MRGSGRPLWDDLNDLAALDPGPAAFDPTPDVLVVGGGVAGLATAAFLRTDGVGRVLVCERDRLGSGASGRAAGGLSPDVHPELPDRWRSLARQSLAVHRDLDASWHYGLRPMDWVVPSGDDELRFEAQAHVDPLRFVGALAARAGAVATGVEVLDETRREGRVTRVATSRGEVSPGAVVWCTGVAPVGAGVGARTAVKGHLLSTEPWPHELPHGIGVAGGILALQTSDGRIVAGGTLDVGDRSPDVRDDVVALIRDGLTAILPSTGTLATTHAWTCFRPKVVDDLPLVDRVAACGNAWYVAGLYRTGLLMAPVVGRALARWVVSGERPSELAGLGIDRGRY